MTTEEVQQALIALGSTPQEVRDSLIAAGCKGFKQSCTGCHIAQFLKTCGVEEPQVDLYWTGKCYGLQGLPQACLQFINEFDRGYHHNLDRSNS